MLDDAAPAQAQEIDRRTPPDTLVNGGALQLALNVLRRDGKGEVADELEKTAITAQTQADALDAAGFTRGFNAATCVALQVLRGAGDTDSASWREILNAAGRAEVENYAKNIAPENWKLCGFAQLDAARAAQGGAA